MKIQKPVIGEKDRRKHPSKERFRGKPHSIEEIMMEHPDEFQKCLLISNIANSMYFTPFFFHDDKCYGVARGSTSRPHIQFAERKKDHAIWKYHCPQHALPYHHPALDSLRKLKYKFEINDNSTSTQ
jgi:hypothetical protein